MAIAKKHIHFYREIFSIPGLLAEPLLMLGLQNVIGRDDDMPEDFDYANSIELLASLGITDVTTVDLFDPRADLRYDLNHPVPKLSTTGTGPSLTSGPSSTFSTAGSAWRAA